MRYLTILIVFASAALIIYGFTIDVSQQNLANKFIGSGTLLLFLVAMPLFLIKESKGKDFKDYMLTDENVRKMQGKSPRKPEDS